MIKHIGFIMDGNRRHAKEKGLNPWQGHEAGAQKVKEVLDWCFELDISEATFYAFSMENFKRDKLEVSFLFKLFSKQLDSIISDIKDLHDKGTKIIFLGEITRFPQELVTRMQELMDLTKNNTKLTVNFAMAYSGRAEIVAAVKKLITDGASADSITEQSFLDSLWLSTEPELIIRTSGEHRTSNFLPYQSIYSEWFFVKSYWPDFSKEELLSIIKEYEGRERRFGK